MDHLNHPKFLETINLQILNLIREDHFLNHLPADVTLEELNDLVDLENGKCWKLFIDREDGFTYHLIVNHNATLIDLKKSLERHFELLQQRKSSDFVSFQKKINWKYIWKNWHLCFDGHKLDDNNAFIKDYGIVNKSRLKFVKRLNKR